MAINKSHPALVLGMFETGLGVVRSLGKSGITVYGFDFKKDIAFYSKFVKASICPHPVKEETAFLNYLIAFSNHQKMKPVLFVTSDNFLNCVSNNSGLLKNYFLFNIASADLIVRISNKYEQYLLACNAGINVPETIKVENKVALSESFKSLKYPVFIKASDVNHWRQVVGGAIKGFVAETEEILKIKSDELLGKGLSLIIQEIIPGTDINHFKYCGYISQEGKILMEFTLRKIRQNPIHFGVGSVVESIEYRELLEEGRKFITALNYKGVGSIEFKYDKRDGKLKLIELNPRYWQQNSLSSACGMNFPLIDYLEVTDQNPEPVIEFEKGVKWVNRYMDFDSFIKYHKEGVLSYRMWRNSLFGKKVYSDFTWEDPIPALYEIGFGLKLLKAPWFLIKKILR